MKTFKHAVLVAFIALGGSVATAHIPAQETLECQSIQCLSFSDDVLMDAVVFLADENLTDQDMTTALKEAIDQVRKTDGSYTEKTSREIAADIVVSSNGRSPGW